MSEEKKHNEEVTEELKDRLHEILACDEEQEEDEEKKEEPVFTEKGTNFFGINLPRLDESAPMEKAKALTERVVWWEDTKQNARIMAACLAANTPIYLEGPAGVGKTFFAEIMASSMGLRFSRMIGSKYRMADSLFVEKDVRQTEKGPITVYTPTELLREMINGGTVLIDEANIIKADTLAELNLFDRNPARITDLAGKLVEMPNGQIEPFPEDFIAHPNFRLILAGNYGDNFHGTKEQNYATLTRFQAIKFERTPFENILKIINNRIINKILGPEGSLEDLKAIQEMMQPILEISKKILDKVQEIEESSDPDNPNPELIIYQSMPEISTRELIRYLHLVCRGLTPEEALEDYFTKLGHTHPGALKIMQTTLKDLLTPKE